jgi:hypothetical protein
MIVCFKNLDDIDERKKAVGIPIKHKEKIKVFWCPKSLINNADRWEKDGFIDIPDWFYYKKIDELF